MTSKEMAKAAIAGLEEKKGNDVRIIDISNVSVVADYFIIAIGVSPRQIEGYQTANWILMDFNDVIVHIFNEEDRLFYNLEKIWLDGKVIDASEL